MAMLAEQKRKKRWSINPRGTLWTNDENKFGQKLLEKMGWSKGKGLGKEEQGCKEPIRLSMNEEQRGVGYKGKSDLEWTKHYDAFEDILSNLNSFNNTTDDTVHVDEKIIKGVESLEKKSKGSKSRVHYHKFTRGKDLSRYNADDLACVLGSKRVKSNITEGEVEQQLVAPLNSEKFQEETEIGQTAKSHGLTTVHGGNLKDYFSQKMIELKRKRGEGIIGYTGDTDQSNEEMNDVSFPNLEFEPEKFSFSFNVSQSINEAGEEDKKSYSSKIKKSKKKDKECLEETIESMTPIKSKVEKKSKKKIKHLQTEILIEETVHTKNKKSKNGGHQKLDEFSEVEMAHKREKSFKKKKENMDSSENNDSGECRNSLVSEIKDCTYNANIDCHNSIAVENIEDCSVLPQGKKKNKKRKLEKNISNLECPIKGDIVNDADIHDIVEEENVANQSKELNDSYGIAMSVMNEKKRKHREGNSENRAPLKKIKKFTSELNLADLFKSSSSLVPCDEATAEGKSLPGKKIKLSAKKSFKELKSGMEAKLKRIKEICNEQDLPEKVTKDNSLNICNEKELTESNESALCGTNEANIRKFNGKINRPSLINIKEIEVNMNDIFPGSNLADIKGYD